MTESNGEAEYILWWKQSAAIVRRADNRRREKLNFIRVLLVVSESGEDIK